MFLPKLDRKVVKNEKKQKKAIAFFSAGGHISEMAKNNIYFWLKLTATRTLMWGSFQHFCQKPIFLEKNAKIEFAGFLNFSKRGAIN